VPNNLQGGLASQLPQLENAWSLREKTKSFEGTEAVRIFYGPTEGQEFLSEIAIDQYGSHAWVTEWESSRSRSEGAGHKAAIQEVIEFLKKKKYLSAVALFRPEKDIPATPQILFGTPPLERFSVSEGAAKFWIQLQEVKHPGLFLDHAPLRKWLLSNTKGLRVLNTFAYTGSLSIAAGLGGAAHVTTLDLSKPTIEWARANWTLNDLAAEASDFIYGDYFEWLPKLHRKDRKFDCVILDPPSFSRGSSKKKGNFSTSKDLVALHENALDVLAPHGFLITSLNSANVSKKKYASEIQSACKAKGMKLEVLREISLPASFPIPTGEEPYLKGWILKRS
jgi:23S rRNA G2069 N7-methylase RlmK/C1962 C5-methylase RlmI